MRKIIAIFLVLCSITLVTACAEQSISCGFETGETEDFTYHINDDGDVVLDTYKSENTSVEIPSEINGNTVVELSESMFAGTEIESIKIPDTVKEIGVNQFYMCSSLSEVTLPEGIEIINAGTFEKCTALKKVKIPASVIEIGSRAFAESGIEEIELPEGLKTIRETAFGSTNIREVEIPASVEKIENNVFDECQLLTDIYFINGNCVIDEEDYAEGFCVIGECTIPVFDALNIHGPEDSLLENIVTGIGYSYIPETK